MNAEFFERGLVMKIKIGKKTQVFLYLMLIIISVCLYYNINKSNKHVNTTDISCLNFQLSMKDIEEFNCFYDEFTNKNIKFSSNLTWNNNDISVDISPINYYSKGILSQDNLAFTIKTNKRNTIYGRRQYEMFPMDSNKSHTYSKVIDMAKKLSLFISENKYYSISINNVSYGLYAMRQQYNQQFLEENHLNNSLIFKLNRIKNNDNEIIILASNLEKEIDTNIKLAMNNGLNKDMDISMYTDMDYIARLKAIANMNSLNEDFYISENTIYIYNNNNNKIYPVIDEVYLSLLDSSKANKSNKVSFHGQFTELMKEQKLLSKSQQYIAKLIESEDKDILYTEVSKDIKMQYGINTIEKFMVGNKEAIIDNKNKLIFVNLDSNALPVQNIKYEFSLENIPITIKSYKDDKETILHNDKIYDFNKYIYRGQISFEDNEESSYDLIVTTGQAPVIVVDTKDNKGNMLEIMEDDKQPCLFQLLSSTEIVNIYGDIEYKGDITNKSSYSVKLNKSLNLSQERNVRNYILDSNYYDPSFIRKKLSYDLLTEINNSCNHNINTPRCSFAELIVNGQYKGVYNLMEEIDNQLLGLADYDINLTYNSLLYKAHNVNANFTANNTKLNNNDLYKSFPDELQPINKEKDPLLGWHSGYKQKYPKVKEFGEQYSEIEKLINYIVTAEDEDFNKNIFNIIDSENLVNLNILMQLQNNINGSYDNLYIGKDKGEKSKWFFITCNEAVFGRDSIGTKTSEVEIVTNNLLNRCMNIYKNQLIDRWNVLSKNIITEDNIIKMIQSYDEIIKDASKRDINNLDTNFQDELTYMKDWIIKRIDFLNNYYGNLR
jgi:hypothetical protein